MIVCLAIIGSTSLALCISTPPFLLGSACPFSLLFSWLVTYMCSLRLLLSMLLVSFGLFWIITQKPTFSTFLPPGPCAWVFIFVTHDKKRG